MNNKKHYKRLKVRIFSSDTMDVITASYADGDYLMEDIFYGENNF